jgi:hypothetical protein
MGAGFDRVCRVFLRRKGFWIGKFLSSKMTIQTLSNPALADDGPASQVAYNSQVAADHTRTRGESPITRQVDLHVEMGPG